MQGSEKKYIYKKVLVVDDTAIDRIMAERIVRKYDFAEEVVLFESAEQMLDYLRNLPANETEDIPQLILLDINMPGIDGWEFLRLFDLFDKEVKDQFRIFIVSSSISSEDKERAFNNEYVLDYIVKPLSKEILLGMNARMEQKIRERTRYLAEALKKEKELNLLKSRFVSLASHEFRTPISGILSSANLLSKYITTEDQPKRDKHIENILSSVNVLIGILNDFLYVGKIQEGKVSVKYTEITITDYFEKVLAEMQAILESGQSLVHKHEGNHSVFLDSILLKHILINLISNAAKFSPSTSVIEVTTKVTECSFVLTVKDNGMGIPEEDQSHLFGLFFRAANATNIPGTGLGLYIIAKYVQIMNGTVDFRTGLNLGTEFIINFPKNK